MTTVRDIINASLREIGVLASGETAGAADFADALESLNRMMSAWATERLMAFTISAVTFSLVSGQQNYTMGPSGNVNAARPVRIDHANIHITTNSPPIDLPLDLLTDDEWAAITVKGVTSTYPTKLYSTGDYPLTTLSFWPIPTVVNQIVLYVWAQLGTFASVNSAVSLPPGYEDALMYNLAVRLGPPYGMPASEDTRAMAVSSKAALKSLNITPEYLFCDDALISPPATYNYLTDNE